MGIPCAALLAPGLSGNNNNHSLTLEHKEVLGASQPQITIYTMRHITFSFHFLIFSAQLLLLTSAAPTNSLQEADGLLIKGRAGGALSSKRGSKGRILNLDRDDPRPQLV